MPAGDGVAAGGWDGSVRTTKATPWVPEGLSVWELSVNASPSKKADEDYAKRAETPDGTPTDGCTYVEAILRPWTTRNAWATNKRETKVWKDVRALGLDDIETWLEAAPITWAWLSEELELAPYGLRTGLTWWHNWAEQTNPVLTPDVVLAGRGAEVQELQNRIESADSIVTLSGASIEELCAFVAAVAINLDGQGKGQMLARLVFVDALTTWRHLIASPQPLLLVPRTSQLADEIPVDTSHTICVPVLANENADITLPALHATELAAALEGAGVQNEKADTLGRLGRRSLTALRRKIAVKPELQRPRWAETPPSRSSRAILLAGAWKENSLADRSIIELLSGCDYESFKEEITGPLDHPADPLVMQTSGTWHLVSAVDAWILLISKLTHEDLQRFEAAVETVLTEANPALNLPRDKQWRATIDGNIRRHSDDLRRGIAQSLTLLGTYGGNVTTPGGASGSEFANYIVRKLLKWASSDTSGHGWESLADILPLLAEASPEEFLDAVSADSRGDEPLLANMFQDKSDEYHLFSGSSPHTNLLWALERLSWSKRHFARVVTLLARLDEIDPGGRLSNRPSASLAAIFCPWHPESSVELDRRIKVLDMLRRRHTDAAWKLESSMLPEIHDTHFAIDSPTFQTWKPDSISITYGVLWNTTSQAIERCIEDAHTDIQRWTTILEHTGAMRPIDRNRVIDTLDSFIDQPDLPADFRESIWRALEELIDEHQEFSDAEWALPDEDLSKLKKLAGRYHPNSEYSRLARLFQSWNPFIGKRYSGDYERYEHELARHRIAAIKAIESEGGFEAITRLAQDESSVPWAIGTALASIDTSHDEELLGCLAVDEPNLSDIAMMYFSARYKREGFELITDILARDNLTVDQRARLLLVARDNLPEVWNMIAADQELKYRYWTEFQPFGLGHRFDRLDEVCEGFMKVGRYADVLQLISMYARVEKEWAPEIAKRTVQALDALLADEKGQAAASSLQTYIFQQVFDYLEAMSEHLDPGDLTRLEWEYLPALGYETRVPTLSQSLATDPTLFVKIVCILYRAKTTSENRDAVKGDDGEKYSTFTLDKAYRLLNAWDSPPGLVNGAMHEPTLRAWLDQAVELLQACGRVEVGLQQVGQVLGHTPPDPDGIWPGIVVQDLLESVELEHLEKGLYLYIVNSRGITSRDLDEGGDQERELATKYQEKAEAFSDSSPRVAAIFRRVADSYEREARCHEADAERFRRGLQ